ncbi:MAG: tetratricopeptide repeat protein [Planctomycetota bacterium]|nr:tetratricopeptide repeat protein [Planctomycetota bacterium]
MLHSTPTPAVTTLVEINDLRDMLGNESDFGSAHYAVLQKATNRQQATAFRQEVDALRRSVDAEAHASDSTFAKLGVSLHLLGQHQAAFNYLSRTTNNAVASFVCGMVCISLERFEDAAEYFSTAAGLGHDAVECELQRVGALRMNGQREQAEAALRKIASKAVSRADYSFQMGCLLADKGDTLGGIEYFERAVDMDPHHTRALFWLAGENCRHGNDEEAIRLYEQALSSPPLHIGALLNLGLLYEDSNRLEQAAFCFRRVLEADPTNDKARLYLKDIDASEGMYYDEDSVKAEQKRSQTLTRAIADFELSVRSRNCLERLGMRTLGDLTEMSEQELMSSRNFGDTSLKEIQELLEQNGLSVGCNAMTRKSEAAAPPKDLSPEQRSAMEQPISDLNLSVRARKCMSRLNISAIGELLSRSPDDLLSSKNFGVTSLNEIRAKLGDMGLHLRND